MLRKISCLLIIALATSVPAICRELRNGRLVKLDAQPEQIIIDIGKTALIVVDMENDFVSKGGMFDRAGIDVEPIQKVIAPTARTIAAARKAGIKIIYLKMGYLPDLSDEGPNDSPNFIKHVPLKVGESNRAPDGTESRILIRDTWDTDIVKELKPEPGDFVIYKTRYSGFYQTDLDATLKRLNVKYLIVTGVTTSVCVESTIRDATFRDYTPVLLADATAERVGSDFPRTNHDASLLVIQKLFGWISSSDNFAKALTH